MREQEVFEFYQGFFLRKSFCGESFCGECFCSYQQAEGQEQAESEAEFDGQVSEREFVPSDSASEEGEREEEPSIEEGCEATGDEGCFPPSGFAQACEDGDIEQLA